MSWQSALGADPSILAIDECVAPCHGELTLLYMTQQTGSPSNGGEGLKYKKGSSDGKKHIENKATGSNQWNSHMLIEVILVWPGARQASGQTLQIPPPRRRHRIGTHARTLTRAQNIPSFQHGILLQEE